ncbi:hypothetical protein [Anaeropeptidivorans aminofermentans]|uniref:hypothetical protein n=1 Tax=Anaeropeptidivorans aminofermentans TaxID=2934315 RepID=UPI002023E3A7|nr:hypothetical protein [Anaeropeptidivorans aminofermentans]
MKRNEEKGISSEKKLSSIQKKALKLMLYGGMGIEEISKETGASSELLYKWLTSDALFIKELEKGLSLNSALFESLIKSGVPQAAETLNFLSKYASSESTRLSASKEIINYVKSLEDKREGDLGELPKLIEDFPE